jgi:hypothetical protein
LPVTSSFTKITKESETHVTEGRVWVSNYFPHLEDSRVSFVGIDLGRVQAIKGPSRFLEKYLIILETILKQMTENCNYFVLYYQNRFYSKSIDAQYQTEFLRKIMFKMHLENIAKESDFNLQTEFYKDC